MAETGYARVSTRNQKIDSQLDLLQEHGCEKIFSEKASGRKDNRTRLDKCPTYLREEDALVIYKLDRRGRTTRQLIKLLQWLSDNGIVLEIIDMNISTKNALEKMLFIMMSSFAEQKANLLSERTKKGLDVARGRYADQSL